MVFFSVGIDCHVVILLVLLFCNFVNLSVGSFCCFLSPCGGCTVMLILRAFKSMLTTNPKKLNKSEGSRILKMTWVTVHMSLVVTVGVNSATTK